MKKNIFLSGLMALLLFSACKADELITYEHADYIVFRYRMAIVDNASGQNRVDSVVINLASIRDQTSIRFGIPVQVIGNVVDMNRPIPVRLAPLVTDTISGDIELLPSYIRAGRNIDTLWVQLNESESLRAGRRFRAVVELQDSEFFRSDFLFRLPPPRQNDWTTAKLFTLDVLYEGGLPNLWIDLLDATVANALRNVWGDAGRGCIARFRLMQEVSGFSFEEFWDLFVYNPFDFMEGATQPPHIEALWAHPLGLVDLIGLWGRIISAKLREAREAGTPERDENGNEIRTVHEL